MRTFWIGLLTALSVGFTSGAWAFRYLSDQVDAVRADLPKLDEPGTFRPPQKTRILAADGTLLTEIFRENRELLPLGQIPLRLRQATIATEDRRFRDHIGISPRDIARAMFANLREGRSAQGASTITQQLVRDLYLSRRKQLRRKIGEALLAVELERRYSKDEILELYLNQVNYGKGLYGVRTAAQAYFAKAPEQLTVAQAAALAAIPQRPTDYHLYTDHDGAVRRRDHVLELMCSQGYLSTAERDKARREPLVVRPYHPPDFKPRHAPYYTTWAIKELIERLGEEKVYAGGLNVTTNLDLHLQDTADDAVRQAVRENRGRGADQGAAVLLEPRTGQILALVGGTDFEENQFNRATQAKRQPGSAFKLFVYTAAIDRGYRPTDRLTDEPVEFPDGQGKPWKPTNYDHVWHGEVTLTQALAQSINIPAVKLNQKVGPATVAAYAQKMGIRSPLRPVLSLALGTSEVNLLELTAAYGVLPLGGLRIQPSCIRKVEDLTGKVIYSGKVESVAVLPPTTAKTMTEMLQAVMTEGTGKPAALADCACAGKTGTTQDGRDAWFVGFSPGFACGVWLGNDAYQPMSGIHGGTDCGPAWRKIMAAALQRRGGPREFSFPSWLDPTDPRNSGAVGYDIQITGGAARSEVKICPESELLATPFCPHPVMRSFDPGAAPTATCPLHRAPAKDKGVVGQVDAEQGASGEHPVDETRTDEQTEPATKGLRSGPGKPQPAAEPATPATRQLVVCADSGLLAKPTCPRQVVKEFGPGEGPTKECDQH